MIIGKHTMDIAKHTMDIGKHATWTLQNILCRHCRLCTDIEGFVKHAIDIV